jgi:hypothetical protein
MTVRTVLGLVAGIAAGLLAQLGLVVLAVQLVRQVSPEAPALPVVLGFLVVQVMVAVLLLQAIQAHRDITRMEARAAQAIRDRGTNLERIQDMEAITTAKEKAKTSDS